MLKAKVPGAALAWKLLNGVAAVFISARRQREEKMQRDAQKRVRDTARLVEKLEEKDPRMRRFSGGGKR